MIARRALALLAFGGAAAVLVACSAILGARDVTLVDADAETDGALADGAAPPETDTGASHDATSDAADGAAIGSDADAAIDADAAACAADLATDPHHCGRCFHDCLGGGCAAGACQPIALAQGQEKPAGIAIDAAHVYWVTYGGWAVMRVDKSGADATRLAYDRDAGVSAPWAVAVDDASVYWGNHDQGDPPGQIVTCTVAACASTTRVLATNLAYPESVAVDGTNVFWGESFGHNVGRVGKDGGGAGNLVTGLGHVQKVAVDDTYVFFATDDGVIGRVAKSAPVSDAGGPFVTLYADPNGFYPDGLAADGARVLWSELADVGRVQVAPRDGGAPRVFAATQPRPHGIAVDATNVYWAASGPPSNDGGTPVYLEGAILSCPKSGCGASGPTVLAAHQHEPYDVAVDDVAVYWTAFGIDAADGAILKVAK